MARFTVEGFDDLDKMFERLSKPQHLATKAVRAAAPILVKETRRAIKEQGGGDGLARSIDATEPKENQYGTFSVVKPEGRRVKDGTPYVKLAAALEYGTVWPRKLEDAAKIHHEKLAGKPKNEAKPFRQKALNAATSKCEEAMIRSVFDEVEKLI